jgi:MOSC domain-containing protein YiiM
VTEGLALNDLAGVDFELGTAVLRGVRECDPCRYLEELLGRPGLLRALEGRGGLRAAILRSGRIRVGDTIRGPSGHALLDLAQPDAPMG